jgi:uncharacterized protein YjiS (DUF1127 family)
MKVRCTIEEPLMMTRPIHLFDSLTSEATPAGGNAHNKTEFAFNERRLLELRARYARAEMAANLLADGLLWLGRQYKRLAAAIKDDFKLRAAEAQLLRMSDRELSDLGLCRADIPFAVRDAAHGVMPQVVSMGDRAIGGANENLRRAA